MEFWQIANTPMKRIHTHYDNLKVARNAPPEVIRAAYKTLSQKYHPDRNPNNSEAERIMKIINASYEILSDPDKRKKHDAWIAEQEDGYLDAKKEPGTQDKSTIEFSPPVAGVFLFDDLPKQARERLVERVSGKKSNQLAIKTDGVVWNYFWTVLAFGWFFYLFQDANEYKWAGDTWYWYIGITFGAAFLGAWNMNWIYLWHAYPLRSWLIFTPLYVIKTHLNKVFFWPIYSISDIRATHNYKNGVYQGTSLSIYFDGKLESFTISPESIYKSVLDSLKNFDQAFRLAVNKNNINYLIENDDFISCRLSDGIPEKVRDSNLKRTLIIYLSVFSISAFLFIAASQVNENRPIKIYQSSYSKPPEYTSIQPPERSGYVRPLMAPNGEPWPISAGYIKKFKKLHMDGLSTVTVDNSQNDSDVFVKLVSLSGTKAYPVRVFLFLRIVDLL